MEEVSIDSYKILKKLDKVLIFIRFIIKIDWNDIEKIRRGKIEKCSTFFY